MFRRIKGHTRLIILAALAAAFLLVPAAQAFAEGTLKVRIEGGGSGEISSVGGLLGNGEFVGTPPIQCTYASPGPQAGTCENEMEFNEGAGGSFVALHAVAAAGSELAEWTIEEGITAFGCKHHGEGTELQWINCALGETAGGNAEVVAVFEPVFPISVSFAGAGSGAVTGGSEAEPNTLNCSSSCQRNYFAGSEVTLHANPEPGSWFEGWSGAGCSGRGACEVTISQAQNVTAIFGEGNALVLNVNGEGTVTSNPAGISCSGGEQCVDGFNEGTVSLTAAPAAGFVIAGWIGCHQAVGDPSTCTLEMDQPREVTAVFLREGTQGAPGANGSNGANGKDGANGTNGGNGKDGAAGPQGPPGPASKVTCTVKGKKKPKVTCTVKQTASSSTARLRWRLMRAGHAVSHGTSTGTLRLELGHLRPGHYRLHVQGQRGATEIEIG